MTSGVNIPHATRDFGLVAVCSNRRSAPTQSGKGHQWWRRDVYHLRRAADPSRTRCGRDCRDWLVIGPIPEVDDNCCERCLAAKAETR